MHLRQQIALTDASQVGEARRLAMATAGDAGFDDTNRGRVALVATELATNLVKHGSGGLFLVGRIRRGEAWGIEVLVLDRGPGIGDVSKCMVDGYSTLGSAGQGLGAVKRLSSAMEIYTQLDKGTAILARLWAAGRAPAADERAEGVGALSVAYPGETVSGDGWAVGSRRDRRLVLVVDGLGHGLLAHQAAALAIRAFEGSAHLPPAALLQVLHGSLARTRGAAAAIAEINHATGVVTYAGVGNIAACVIAVDGASKSLISYNGIVGLAVRKFQEFSYPWPKGATLVMHSDGLGTSWQLRQYPGLLGRDPSLVAAVLYRDFTRGRDDATIVVARSPELAGPTDE